MKIALVVILFGYHLTIHALVITSLNVQWYGRGGIISGSEKDEYRDLRLKELITKQVPASDVLVFQEITAPHLLVKAFSEFKCHTYDAFKKRHQHVVICAKEEIIISHAVDYAIQLDSRGLRPAMILNVADENGDEVSIVGVHLKAGPKDSAKRLKQVSLLTKGTYLTNKMVIIGDFNTFPKERTGLSEDDHILMNDMLGKKGFTQVGGDTTTFIGDYIRTFDRVWLKGLEAKNYKVYGPCSQGSLAAPFSLRSFYTRFISDHCLLQLEI
jgi:endonuclease/exonuclease/phosphatase family metal-dependent hydrolase